MKSFSSFIKEEREFITKSWYHPDSKQEVIVDAKPRVGNWGGYDSHSNHLYHNPELYGFDNIKDIFTKAGHPENLATELTDRLKTHHGENGGYVDWHDPLVHAMHKHGWVRVVKSNIWDRGDPSPQPHLYVGSHDHELNQRAANDLQKDGETKKVSLASYKERGLNDEDSFSPASRAKYKDYVVDQ
jgi:hypothetical protein